MKRTLVFAALLLLLISPLLLFAKGDTVSIVVRGKKLPAPLVISDPKIVSRFDVWTGPGTSPSVPQGFLVNWARGLTFPAKGLTQYEVSVVTSLKTDNTYTVFYVFDAQRNEGYIYIPGKDDANYSTNVRMVYRGVEGQWFYAWDAWTKVVNPLIQKAGTAR